MIAEPAPQGQIRARARELLAEQGNAAHRQTDRLFAGLLLLEWLAGMAVALWISPRTWIGSSSQWHIHVWAAIVVGATIALPSAAVQVGPAECVPKPVPSSLTRIAFGPTRVHR